MGLINFLKIALKDYRTVGAMAPGSKYFSERVAKTIKPGSKLVIEYGPGSGVISREILKLMPVGGRLMVIEKNPDFVAYLKAIKDPRLTVIHQDVFTVLDQPEHFGIGNADAIISGIPFLVFADGTHAKIIAKTFALLKPGGTFSFYQNLPIVHPALRHYFSNIRWQFEPRNIMPYFIFTGEK